MYITERVLYPEVKRKCSTAKTNLESLLLERLLLLCELARAHRRKGSLPRLCGERVLLRIIDTLRLSGLVYPHQTKRRASTHAVSRNTRRKVYMQNRYAQTTAYLRLENIQRYAQATLYLRLENINRYAQVTAHLRLENINQYAQTTAHLRLENIL